MTDVYDLIAEEDLTSDLQMVADICGMDTVKILLRNLHGLSFYVPKISHLDTLVKKYMKRFPEKNYKQIAKELRVSEPYLKSLAKRKCN